MVDLTISYNEIRDNPAPVGTKKGCFLGSFRVKKLKYP
jgi:hypothetical protein